MAQGTRMKKEIYEALKPLERILKSALMANYAILSAKDFELFSGLYEKHYGKPLTRAEKGCNTCRLKALKAVANDYFEYADWYAKRWGERTTETNPDKESEEKE